MTPDENTETMSENDSLFEDSSGHAADFFEHFEEGGMEAVNQVLHDDNWDMGLGWGTCQLMAVEALAAAGGKSAGSAECHYLVEFGKANPAEIDKETHDRMLHVIDQVIEKIKTDPEAAGLDPDCADEVLAGGALMRARVSEMTPDGEGSGE